MGTGNWIIDSLYGGLQIWNEKLAEIWSILTQSPQSFKGGGIWQIIISVHGALQAIGFSLLVLFFAAGVIKTSSNFAELKRPEIAVKMFIRFILAKTCVTYGLDLMMTLFRIIQGVISTIMSTASGGIAVMTVPDSIITTIQDLNFLESLGPWVLSVIAMLGFIIMSFVVLLTVYGRFFKIYLYTAIAPIPLSAFAGEPTQGIGKSFLKSFAGVCLEGAIIVLAIVIFSAFGSTPPVVAADASPMLMVVNYCAETIFIMLVMVFTVRAADRIVREMMGF